MPNCPLTLRLVKGSKLTFSELDQNFLSLNTCINSVNSNFVNYLPLSGGTLTGPLSACTGISTDNLYPCSDTLTIWGNLVVQGSATTINTEIIKSQDNNIILNYSGTHLTAIGGGITVEDGQSNGVDSRIYTDTNGYWVFDPGLSATTGTINSLSACTGIWTSNLHGCSPIVVHDTIELVTGIIRTSGGTGAELNIKDPFGPIGTWSITSDNGGYTSGSTWVYGQPNNGAQLAYQISTYPGEAIGFGVYDTVSPNIFTGKEVVISNNITTSITSGNIDRRAIFIGTKNSTIQSGVTNSVIIGGSNITATNNDTVYVDNLNIKTIGAGAPIINLGLDNGGNVVTGVTTIDTNFAINDLTFTGNRYHNINGNELFIYDSGGLNTTGPYLYSNPFLKYISIGHGNREYLDIGQANGTSGFTFFTNYLQRMVLDVNGNLGIGTNTPSEKLTVSGNTNISGTLNIGTLGTNPSVFNLGIDSNGYVVSGTTSKYANSVSFVGGVTQTITHNLNDLDVIVQLKDSFGSLIIPNTVNNYTLNTVDINVASTETYRVIIIK